MTNISVYNEFGSLGRAIIRRPIGSAALCPINAIQAHYFKSDPPSPEQLLAEHKTWTNILEGFGVRLDYLEDAKDGSHNPCFTRDVGFAIGNRFFLSSVVEDLRKGEIATLQRWLDNTSLPYEIVGEGFIEGGDILVDAPYVYVGVGQRTDNKGVSWLSNALGPSWEVIPIQLEEGILHLDCVLSIVGANTMIWCPDLIVNGRSVFEDRYKDTIAVTKEDVFDMATNVLMVNPTNAIVEQSHDSLQHQLQEHGICVHALKWPEMKKFGGLFRCAICPLERENTS